MGQMSRTFFKNFSSSRVWIAVLKHTLLGGDAILINEDEVRETYEREREREKACAWRAVLHIIATYVQNFGPHLVSVATRQVLYPI